MSTSINERKLIGNILKEENDSEEETAERYKLTKRNTLLKKEELKELTRSASAPAGFQVFPEIFWPRQPLSPFRSTAPEFIPSCSQRSEFAQYQGQLYYMVLDQSGSRYIQECYKGIAAPDKVQICEELLPSVYTLSIDIFANYVIQMILEHGPDEHKALFVEQLQGYILDLSFNTYGCRVVQKILQFAGHPQKLAVAEEVKSHVDELVDDQNANHVVQKCVLHLRAEDARFILERCERNCLKWAMHPYGCMVVQRTIETYDRDRIQGVVACLVECCPELSVDPYGNYVLQYLIEKGDRADRHRMIALFAGNLAALSRHQYSSNVIEKCLQFAGSDEIKGIVLELFNSPEFVDLMLDRFGNFVIQKCIEVTIGKTKQAMINRIYEHANTLKQHHQGKFILNSIEKLKNKNKY